MPNPERLTRAEYRFVTATMPIICVDVIPVREQQNQVQLGYITRATGCQKDKAALIGGRVVKNEHLSEAIGRHLNEAFAIGEFAFHPSNCEGRPFFVAQHAHATESGDLDAFDPTKHSIAMTYLIEMADPSLALMNGEASAFHWASLDELPQESAFDHHLTLQKAADFLRSVI